MRLTVSRLSRFVVLTTMTMNSVCCWKSSHAQRPPASLVPRRLDFSEQELTRRIELMEQVSRSRPMPRGDKSSYTNKQKRMARHIEEGYEERGISEKESERRAWATVNKETHGGKKSGSGRGRKRTYA